MERGESYQLKKACLLVDAKHYESQERYPKEIPFAHVLDQRKNPYKYLGLNDNAAFIAGFIVLGVDVALIPEILRSEYRLTLGDEVDEMDFKDQVGDVVKLLKEYDLIEGRTIGMTYDRASVFKTGNNECGYPLDFGVHSFGIGCIKIPPPPPPPPIT